MSFANLLFIPAVLAAVLNVNQSKIRLVAAPGESKSGIIEVENPTKEDMIIKVYTEDWVYAPARDGSKEFYNAGTMPRSCAKWISFVPADIIVPPLGKQNINYTVKVPKNAGGTNCAVLFFETMIGRTPAVNGEQDVGVNLVVRVGTIFLVETGDVLRQARIDNLSLDKNSDGKYCVNLDFRNTGNSDITTEGTLDVIDDKGMVYARGLFNALYTLPGDPGKLLAVVNQDIPAGVYDMVMTFNLGKARLESGLKDGPVLVKEAGITVGEAGEITKWQEKD